MSRFSEAKDDVAQVFPEPEDLVAATDLSREEKLDLLRQWEHDLRLLQVASEDLPGVDAGTEVRTAERLARVQAAIDAVAAADAALRGS
jgi:hypothetical protein